MQAREHLRHRVLVASPAETRPDAGCDFCRISGTVVFTGVSAYMVHSSMSRTSSKAGKASGLFMATVFAGLAVARWRTP